MKELEDFTLAQMSDYLISGIIKQFGVTKSLAKKLFINAISYNIVAEEIYHQVAFLLDEDDE